MDNKLRNHEAQKVAQKMEGFESVLHTLPSGLRLHCLTNRIAPGALAVLFLHGWPSLAFSWRHQLRACPLFAVAVDLPGVGGSDRPDDPSCWSQRRLVAAVFDLLSLLGPRQWVVVGHDWGGVLAWNVALAQDPRVAAVASLCTPFYPFVAGDPLERMRANPGAFDYQVRAICTCRVRLLTPFASSTSWKEEGAWRRQSWTETKSER